SLLFDEKEIQNRFFFQKLRHVYGLHKMVEEIKVLTENNDNTIKAVKKHFKDKKIKENENWKKIIDSLDDETIMNTDNISTLFGRNNNCYYNFLYQLKKNGFGDFAEKVKRLKKDTKTDVSIVEEVSPIESIESIEEQKTI